MEVKSIGCFGAIKQSRRNPRTRLLPGLQPMCPRWPNCSDTDHSTKAVSGQGSDGGSRRRWNGRQESAKGERAEGLMGHGHPVLEAPSEPPITGTAVPYKQGLSIAETTAQQAPSSYDPPPFMIGVLNVSDSSYLTSLDLSPQLRKEPVPLMEMEVFIIMSPVAGEMYRVPKATAFHLLWCCVKTLCLTKHFS